jgi:hypothetical protein
MGMVMLNNLQERLSTDRGMDHIREIVVKKSVTIEKTITKAEKPTVKPSPFRDPTAYRDMLRQGRRFI